METAMLMYQSMYKEAFNYLTSVLKRLSKNTIRELRSTTNDLNLPLLKTSSGQKCFYYKRALFWNNLSAAVIKMHKLEINVKMHRKSVRIPFDNSINYNVHSYFTLARSSYFNFFILHNCN